MKDRHDLMPILRLAYSTQFLIALIAVFVLWSQAGGQSHLDLLPWSVKLGLGLASAYGVVRATAASVSGDRAWNGQTVRWLGLTLAVLAACGYATYYAHINLEEVDDGEQQQDTSISRLHGGIRLRLVQATEGRPGYSSVRFESARRLARSAPTSVTTIRSPS
jgi:predicted outer membrane lipoprotein